MPIRNTNRVSELIRHQGRRYPVAVVEARVREVADVAECAAVQLRTPGGATRSVAFVRTVSGRALTAESLTGLPVDDVVTLSCLPLDDRGAVDYATLRQAALVDAQRLAELEAGWRESHGLGESVVLYGESYDYGSPLARRAYAASPPTPGEAGEERIPGAVPAVPAYVQGPPLLPVPGDARTLTDTLYRAARSGNGQGCHFVDSAGTEVFLPYAGLLERAERVSAFLRGDGVVPGDRILVLAAGHEEFAVALWGALLAGATAVPVTPSADYRERRAEAESLRRIWTTANEPRVLASPALVEAVRPLLDGGALLSLAEAEACSDAAVAVDVDPESPALILFTSGSTGTPKGVVQSHANIVHKQQAAVQHSRYAADDVFLNWLAIEHVVGLIHSHLLPLYLDASQVHAATGHVLARPTRWLDLATRHRATVTWGPNSMLALLADTVAGSEAADWDVSAVRRWINAGEQVHFATCQRLLGLLERYGLPAQAIKPEWGMSETCNMVVVSDALEYGKSTGVQHVDRIRPDGRIEFSASESTAPSRFVECGRVYPGVDVRVVGDAGELLDEGQVGHFQVRGLTRLVEYFNNPGANAKFFRDDDWFDTGDLAFVRDRKVTFTGRGADLIIVNGVNIQNVDLEAVVETVDGVLPSFAAACSVRDEDDVTDHLAIFYASELSAEDALLRQIKEIQTTLRREFSLSARHVVPLPAEDIPKTSIGKIQRSKLVARLQDGTLDERLHAVAQTRGSGASFIPPWFFVETEQPRILPAADGQPVTLGLVGGGPAERAEVTRVLSEALSVRADGETERPDGTVDAVVDLRLTRAGWDGRAVYELISDTTKAIGAHAAGPAKKLRIALVTAAGRAHDDLARAHLGALQGYVRSVNAEAGEPVVVWCDLDAVDEANVGLLARELVTFAAAPAVAYRSGVRTERALSPAPRDPAGVPAGIKEGGQYIVTGGLGGVGRELCRFLAEKYGARLVVVGSTPAEQLDESRSHALRALEARTRTRYVPVDLASADAPELLRAALRSAAEGRVDGAFHLAGLGNFGEGEGEGEALERLDGAPRVDDGRLARYTALKVHGMAALAGALTKDALLVGFSSVNAYFGGAGYAEYSASNSALNASVRSLRDQGYRRALSLGWSAWSGTGMSGGAGASMPIERRGFLSLDVDLALESVDIAVRRNQPVTYIGLDGAHPDVASHVRRKPGWEPVPRYFYVAEGELPSAELTELAPALRSSRVAQIPRKGDGRVDTVRLLQTVSSTTAAAPPETATEQRLAALWEEILGTENLARDDDFFMLGGHSLMAARLANDIRRAFGVTVALHKFFKSSRLSAVASLIDEKSAAGAAVEPQSRSQQQVLVADDGLSSAQRRIYFAERVEPELALYNIVAAWELAGSLESRLLEKALVHVTRRHESLRTAFETVDGVPRSRLVDAPAVPLDRVDLRDREAGEAESVLRETLDRELAHKYDLEAAPPARYTLVSLPAGKDVLVVSHHHIASDGWSLSVFMRDLVTVYNALVSQDVPLLTALPSDITRAVALQDAAGAASGKAADHWRGVLAQETEPLELPTDFPRPQLQSYAGDTLFLELGRDEVRRIAEAAASAGVSSAVFLGTAFSVFLSRLSGQREFFVGMPAMRRDDPALLDTVSMLVNTLPCRMSLAGSASVQDQCAAVHRSMTGLLEHQDYPFDHMVTNFSEGRDTSRPPIVQTMFNYVPREDFPEFTGAARTPIDLRHRIARFDLSLHAYERDHGLTLAFEYATSLFREETVEGWRAHFRTLLFSMASKNGARVRELSVLTPEEQEEVVRLSANTSREAPVDSIAAAFSETARAHGERTAVVHGEQEITYRELDDRSGSLAARLREQGVAVGDRVAIDAEKALSTITGILGILKLGGAYVPIDPELPPGVAASVLRTGGIRWRLSARGLFPVDASGEAASEAVAVPFQDPAPDSGSEGSPVAGSDEAYVMFTSGTTGRPKGVSISQAGVVGLVREPGWITLDERVRVLQTGALSFDASTFEIWAALLNGGTLILTGKDTLLDVGALRREIERSRPTLMWVSAPLFHQLTDADASLFAGVAELVVGGDVVSPAHVNRVLEHSAGIRVTNGYGPTENTTFTTTYSTTRPVDGALPIGRPFPGRIALPLDEAGALVPYGVLGELYVGGEGLALGYVGNEEEADRRFVETGALPGVRLYRTGDWVTLSRDGQLRYQGRRDGQVKVRGHRVELNAVRSALCSLDGVRDAFVVASSGAAGALTAHVAAEGLRVADILEGVRRLVPPYAVPSAVHVYDALPLRSSGKVDVTRLRTGGSEEAPGVVPDPAAEAGELSPQAATLLAAYRSVLGRENVRPDDSFFDLGGDSLLTIKLVSVLHGEGVPVDPKQVFLYPDVRSLAKALDERTADGSASAGDPAAKLVRLNPLSGDGPGIVFAPPAGGTVLGYIELARHLRGFGEIHGVEAPGLGAGESPVYPSFDEMVQFCSDSAAGVAGDGVYIGGHSLGGHIAFYLATMLLDRGIRPKGLIILDTPPRLGDIPVADADLTEEETRVFILAMGIGGMLDQDRDLLKDLPYEEAKKVLLDRAKNDPRVSAFLSEDYLDRFLRLQMHQLMYSRDVVLPRRKLDIPVYVFRTKNHAPEVAGLFSDWENYSVGEVTFVDIPGDHATMLRAPHVSEVAHLLDRYCGLPAGDGPRG
ncbi:amino acid adenylation domain-containing protein [Streptomyces microflavus]|uniref:non-ribosomal peptide synthetase n=1 Tax=Streptomyces microflavus TaxID=1919 RepID=UPI00225AA212|nr:non-ribosomal peptide synthetase [Streptomyces microflavus]MCX4656754.1 amino acid adenylation domain-containing protein [Streptomyces microflavus]